MTAPSIVIVEDDEPVRASLEAVLQSWGFAVTTFADGESFLDACRAGAGAVGAGCILLDIRLPGIGGLAVLAEMRRRGVMTPTVILTGHGDVSMAVEVLAAGADDFIEKPVDDDELVARIGAAMDASQPEEAVRAEHREVLSVLTPREAEVMYEVVAGHPNKVIAHRLGVSPKTVEIHRARVMEKTGAKSLSHLVRMALKAGIDPEGGAEDLGDSPYGGIP